MFKICGPAVLMLILAACSVPRPQPASPAAGAPPALTGQTPGPPGPRVFRIDPDQSELRVLVYRAGPMARFGHNHVMVNRALRGSVSLAEPPAAASFSLNVPVADFVVDDAQSRREEGVDFPGEIADDAKSGTLRNMLSAALLDAAQFPSVTVEGENMAADGEGAGGMHATLTLHVAGHDSQIDVPFMLDQDAKRLSATGSLELRQTALGLTPFSLMMGALQVQDMVRVKFRIVAVAG